MTLLEGIDQTSIRHSPVGGHPDRPVEHDHPYVVAVVAGTSFFGCEAEFRVDIGGPLYNLGSSRLVGRIK